MDWIVVDHIDGSRLIVNLHHVQGINLHSIYRKDEVKIKMRDGVTYIVHATMDEMLDLLKEADRAAEERENKNDRSETT